MSQRTFVLGYPAGSVIVLVLLQVVVTVFVPHSPVFVTCLEISLCPNQSIRFSRGRLYMSEALEKAKRAERRSKLTVVVDPGPCLVEVIVVVDPGPCLVTVV